MASKLRIIGLVWLVICASAVLAPSTASGVAVYSPGGTYPVGVEGTAQNIGEHFFFPKMGTLACETSHYSGELKEESTSLDLTPVHTNCGSFSGLSVQHNECKYRLDVNGHDAALSAYTANFGVACPSGKSMTIKIFTCVLHVPSQSGVARTWITNMGSGVQADLTVKLEVQGITYEATDAKFACPYEGNAHWADLNITTSHYLTLQAPSGGLAVKT